jgi:hypothetical protein
MTLLLSLGARSRTKRPESRSVGDQSKRRASSDFGITDS